MVHMNKTFPDDPQLLRPLEERLER